MKSRVMEDNNRMLSFSSCDTLSAALKNVKIIGTSQNNTQLLEKKSRFNGCKCPDNSCLKL